MNKFKINKDGSVTFGKRNIMINRDQEDASIKMYKKTQFTSDEIRRKNAASKRVHKVVNKGMTKKELREFFGHRFGALKKRQNMITLPDLVIKLDRMMQVISIEYTGKPFEIKGRFDTMTSEQLVQKLNWDCKGQPIILCYTGIKEAFSYQS
jgi:hypothetical protein